MAAINNKVRSVHESTRFACKEEYCSVQILRLAEPLRRRSGDILGALIGFVERLGHLALEESRTDRIRTNAVAGEVKSGPW